MSDNAYDQGRLNLPFVGICTFGKNPYVPDWDAIDADVAVMGAPFDCGAQFRSGARMGPRAIREASSSSPSETSIIAVTSGASAMPCSSRGTGRR